MGLCSSQLAAAPTSSEWSLAGLLQALLPKELSQSACVCAVTAECSLCGPVHCAAQQNPLGLGFLQAGILEWVAGPFSRGSSRPRDGALTCCIFSLPGSFFTSEDVGSPPKQRLPISEAEQSAAPGPPRAPKPGGGTTLEGGSSRGLSSQSPPWPGTPSSPAPNFLWPCWDRPAFPWATGCAG